MDDLEQGFPRAASGRQMAGYAAILAMVGTVASLPPGGLLYVVSSFLFAFSGGQYRMVPVVGWAVWALLLAALLVGQAVLLRTRSLPYAGIAMFLAYCVGWPLVLLIEWRLSFILGAS